MHALKFTPKYLLYRKKKNFTSSLIIAMSHLLEEKNFTLNISKNLIVLPKLKLIASIYLIALLFHCVIGFL